MKKEDYAHNILEIKGIKKHNHDTIRIQQNIKQHCYSCVDCDTNVDDEPCKWCFWLDGDKNEYIHKQLME